MKLDAFYYFCSPIYTIDKPEFLDIVSEVSEEYLQKARPNQQDEIYPHVMTDSYFGDSRLSDFTNFVGETAWNVLNDQGYNMQNKNVVFTEMWTQEHRKHSLMEQHTHGYGSQIIGFYFLDVPENSSKVIFHDPRPGKIQAEIDEFDFSNATLASRMINFEPKPGLLMLTNSWLPHSFSRNASETPMKFVHFNLNVEWAQSSPPPAAEIV